MEKSKSGSTEIVLKDGSTRFYDLHQLTTAMFDAMIGHKTETVEELGNVASVRGDITPFLDMALKACANFKNTGTSVYPDIRWDEQEQKVIGFDDSSEDSDKDEDSEK